LKPTEKNEEKLLEANLGILPFFIEAKPGDVVVFENWFVKKALVN